MKLLVLRIGFFLLIIGNIFFSSNAQFVKKNIPLDSLQEYYRIVIKPDGTSKKFYRIDERTHLDRYTDGLHILFWDSSYTKICREFVMKNGAINGTVKTFNIKGVIKEFENYIDGEEEGYFYYWNDNGKLIKKELYHNGELIKKWVF